MSGRTRVGHRAAATRLARVLAVVTLGVALSGPVVSVAASPIAPGRSAGAGPVVRGAAAVAQELYAPASGEPCGSVESYHDCPVTSRLAAALVRFFNDSDADPLCRCQNSFEATFRNGPALPSAYKGSRKDKVATALLVFGPDTIEMFVSVHTARDGSQIATDTYCAAESGDRHPYRNRMTGSDPGPCVVES